ncbi:LLM class flavin-dependent oxidoreductase [Pseudomonas typographi]|uniref:LLM class flavin-dependent oxidoreductase n=1 Tax=Pseudomonas typographi TaxID=2715964 RepID=A0ABR7YX51_9PSED|nr:LLM class flavin-dependent oxidoreductase [Pseudomonas typographi]MBD1551233.1 LLM class flavin-dependent oxidoreductase [Pseudomonas typographi]MBD1586273.1 LLM class flavin-dependent oxidoreductase [Pseudomonas typographi]MBD1597745.1 LLM class flavin-dependent oxidoreductase [Pseudomonas typographi]
MSTRTLHLNVNVNNSGRHPASWRVAQDPLAFLDLAFYENIGRLAERGKLDAVFFSDGFDYGLPEVSRPWQALDPFIPLTAIARVTERVGLVATVSSSFNHPYNIARKIASLDYVSGGRVAWNVVATRNAHSAGLFGLEQLAGHDERYGRAAEAVEVVKGLWRSWRRDALVADQASGRFADLQGIVPIDHQGDYYRVKGALNVPRSPQGQPVLLQAGGSPQGIALAARHADAVFTVNHSLPAAQAFYRELKAQASHHGRNPDHVLILPGLFPILGGTEEEAQRRKAWLDEVSGFDEELRTLAAALNIPAEALELDAPLPWAQIDAAGAKSSQGFVGAVLDLARREGLSVRQVLARNPNGHRSIVGTPEQVADSIAQWFNERGADGFNLNADFFPEGLEAIVEHLVPELQKRGLFRRDYEGSTLRSHLGLPLPFD